MSVLAIQLVLSFSAFHRMGVSPRHSFLKFIHGRDAHGTKQKRPPKLAAHIFDDPI
jgi:hypothetical protein